MQTILGAGGAIGIPLAKELLHYTHHIRLVSRHPSAVNPGDHLVSADLYDPLQVDRAIAGSKIVYLVVGLEYNTKIWKEKWPILMRNVLDACQKHQAKLVFFDNVYLYDKRYIDSLTESTPVNPCSKKGKIRAELASMFMNDCESGKINGLIARSADFIGLKNSVLTEMVFKNLAKKKKADWIADINRIHSFTFTNDAAKATAILGNTNDAYNQLWHMPTPDDKLTGKQWIQLFAEEMQVKAKYRTMPLWMMSVLGTFIPILKEFKEMAYQYKYDYFLDSTKFKKRFEFEPTSPREAVKWVIKEMGT